MAMNLKPMQPQQPMKTMKSNAPANALRKLVPNTPKPQTALKPLTPAAAAPSARQAPPGARPGSLMAAPNTNTMVKKMSPDGMDLSSKGGCIKGKGGKKLRLKKVTSG